MLANRHGDQSRTVASSVGANASVVSAVKGNHVRQTNGAVVEISPSVECNNTDREIAAPNVDLPVNAASWATTELDVVALIDNGESVEGFNVVPKFDVRRKLIARAVQLICARQRKVVPAPPLPKVKTLNNEQLMIRQRA